MSNKIKYSLLLLILLITTCITGCLNTLGPKFVRPMPPKQDKAVIYVYRQRGVMTAQEMPGVKVNDVEVVKVLPEISYFALSVEPGQYTFKPKLFAIYKTTEATIDARAGRVYFVRLKVNIGHLQFEEMNRDEAMAYMATCYMLDSKNYRDHRVIRGEEVSGTNAITATPKPSETSEPPVAQKVPEIQKAKETVVKVEKTETTYRKEEKAPEPPKQVLTNDKIIKAQLYIEVSPSDAGIRIMNIAPVFKQGIRLDPGRYDIAVSATGFLNYREWITLSKGEEKHLKISLNPKQKQSSLSDPPRVSEQKTIKHVNPEKKIDEPTDISAEERRYAEMLQSDSVTDIRNAAKNVYSRYYTSSYLASVAEQVLLKNYAKEPTRNQIDAMAWLCKALGRNGDSRFAETLKTVVQNSPHRKLKGYAEKSLKLLK